MKHIAAFTLFLIGFLYAACAIAANYILPRVPDALKHFGIDETDLRDMIIARFRDSPETPHVGVSQ